MSHTEIKKDFTRAIINYSKVSGREADYFSIEWKKIDRLIVYVSCMEYRSLNHLLPHLRDLGFLNSIPIWSETKDEKKHVVSFIVDRPGYRLCCRCPDIFFTDKPEVMYSVRIFFMFLAFLIVLYMIFLM